MDAPIHIETLKAKVFEFLDFFRDKMTVPVETVAKDEVIQTVTARASQEAVDSIARRELIAKLISSALGLGASIGLTYFVVNYMTNAMDPTRKEKQKSRERVY